MNENEKSRSGLQTAVDFAHAARAAKRIMQAAAASGVHGAAAATAREAFPLLLKVLIAVLVVFIAVPMVIFTALPNIFFGYNSSGTDTVIQMTQQAMTLGGVYMTLGNFEGAQIDSVVTGIAAEYEKNGTTIDHIVVSSAMTDDDLLWVIAINSAAHQQDLNTMSADLIRDFCKSSLFCDVTDLNWQALEWCNAQNGIYHRAVDGVPQQIHDAACSSHLRRLPDSDEVRGYLCPNRRISFDGFVNYEGRRFGVPYSYAGSTARVMRSGDTLYIYSTDMNSLLATHAVTWSHRDSFCEGQYEVQPEEFPTAPVKTQLRQLPKPASNLSFAKFDFDDEEELL